jgi:hypothetical protein
VTSYTRWLAAALTLGAVVVGLITVRIHIVRQRTGDWAGEGCVIGPYNPTERIYLYAITIVLMMALVVAVTVAIRSRSRTRIAAILLSCGLAVIALYPLYGWGGLEYNNQPHPEMPCSFKQGDF